MADTTEGCLPCVAVNRRARTAAFRHKYTRTAKVFSESVLGALRSALLAPLLPRGRPRKPFSCHRDARAASGEGWLSLRSNCMSERRTRAPRKRLFVSANENTTAISPHIAVPSCLGKLSTWTHRLSPCQPHRKHGSMEAAGDSIWKAVEPSTSGLPDSEPAGRCGHGAFFPDVWNVKCVPMWKCSTYCCS